DQIFIFKSGVVKINITHGGSASSLGDTVKIGTGAPELESSIFTASGWYGADVYITSNLDSTLIFPDILNVVNHIYLLAPIFNWFSQQIEYIPVADNSFTGVQGDRS